MRTEGVQKLILNSYLFKDMEFAIIQEKNLRFSASNLEGKMQIYLIRVTNIFFIFLICKLPELVPHC